MQITNAVMRAYALGSPATEAAAPTVPATPDTASAGKAAGGFGQALTDAITGISDAQNAADDASVRMAAGEPIDVHEVMLARETASLHFQLAVQARNKLLEAYQEVMRMQI